MFFFLSPDCLHFARALEQYEKLFPTHTQLRHGVFAGIGIRAGEEASTLLF
jgi:hypothetical protein